MSCQMSFSLLELPNSFLCRCANRKFTFKSLRIPHHTDQTLFTNSFISTLASTITVCAAIYRFATHLAFLLQIIVYAKRYLRCARTRAPIRICNRQIHNNFVCNTFYPFNGTPSNIDTHSLFYTLKNVNTFWL